MLDSEKISPPVVGIVVKASLNKVLFPKIGSIQYKSKQQLQKSSIVLEEFNISLLKVEKVVF